MTKKRILYFSIAILLVLAAGISIAVFTPVHIPSSADGKIALYARNKPDLELTVALIDHTGTDTRAYGHDGLPISVPDRFYEIGAVTQTFTGAIAAKAIASGRLSPSDTVYDILPLSRAAYSPTVSELLTHSSAYADYLPVSMLMPMLTGGNPFKGFSVNELVSSLNSFMLKYQPPYLYSFSDYGASTAGAVLSEIYDVDFYSILTIFAQEELGLKHTFIATEKANRHGWTWKTDDAFIPSCALTSTVGDLVAYTKLFLGSDYDYLSLATEPLYEINADEYVGYFWNVSEDGRMLSTSGETGHYSTGIIIDRDAGAAVIVLSNYKNDRYGSVTDIAKTILSEKLYS